MMYEVCMEVKGFVFVLYVSGKTKTPVWVYFKYMYLSKHYITFEILYHLLLIHHCVQLSFLGRATTSLSLSLSCLSLSLSLTHTHTHTHTTMHRGASRRTAAMRRWDQRNYEIHRKRLSSIKPRCVLCVL